MTNLAATLLITVSTNWLGVNIDNKEPGLSVTNYNIQAIFDGKTNNFLLEKRYGNEVIWRERQWEIFVTNNFPSWNIRNAGFITNIVK